MKPLRQAIQDYLALRRSLGFKLRDAGSGCRSSPTFLRPVARHRLRHSSRWSGRSKTQRCCPQRVRSGLAMSVASLATRLPSTREPRFRRRGCCRFARAGRDPSCIRRSKSSGLLSCALELAPTDGLRPWTYHCLLGLLSVTGMRIGEAIRLQLDDVNLAGRLTDASRHQVRQIPPGTDPSLDPGGTRTVSSAPRALRGRHCRPRSSSSRVADITWTSATSIEPSTRSRARSVCALPTPATGRACMTSVIDLQSRHCCDGTARARMSSDACRCSRPTSGTSMSPIPTGISVAVRN